MSVGLNGAVHVGLEARQLIWAALVCGYRPLMLYNSELAPRFTVARPCNPPPDPPSSQQAHDSARRQDEVAAWTEERVVSKYAEGLEQLPATRSIPMDPAQVPRGRRGSGVARGGLLALGCVMLDHKDRKMRSQGR